MGWWRFLKFCRALIREVGEDDLSGRAAEMAYKFFLAFMPFLIFLVAAGAFVAEIAGIDDPSGQLMNQIGPSLPDDAASVLRTQLESLTSSRSAGLLSFGIIGSIWAASSGVGTVMKALNRILEVEEERPLPLRYAVAVGLTVFAGAFILASVVVVIAGQTYGSEIAASLGLTGFASSAVLVLRFALVTLLLLSAVSFVYWAAPAIELPFKFITPGAVFFVLLWLVFTTLFGVYVANFGSYNATYGALGGVVILLVWLYFSSFLFLLGAQINAVLAGRDSARAAEGETEKRGGILRLLRRLPFLRHARVPAS